MASSHSPRVLPASNTRMARVRTLVCLLVVLASVPGAVGFFGEWGPDLEGPWCATRSPGQDCCTGRDDYCAVPILGTECYCDIFCNDTAYDCCPDYWNHCHGHRVPTTTPRPTELPAPRPTRDTLAPCTRDGVSFRPGETIRDNCNNCTCYLFEIPYRRYEWQCSKNICLLRPVLIQAVNDNPDYQWSATNYSQLWGLTLDEGIRYRLGTFQLADNVVDMTAIKVEDDVLPESFDARVKWPNLLHPITDQGNCASSWAHSTTAVASDRLSIETEGAIKDRLSIQHLLSCNVDGQLGCNGGHLDRAWWFLRQQGVVSDDCYPYTSGSTSNQGVCLISQGQTVQRCPSGLEYKTDKRFQATPPYRISPMEREIMKEIQDNGPVQATLLVREDFFMYRRGVYKYTQLTSLRSDSEDHMKSGFHSVRIIGWGADRTSQGDIIKYWICANSWGPEWGENGYFRIIRGNDESSIESFVIGVWGKISGDPELRVLLSENRRRRQRVQRARRRRHLRHLKVLDEQKKKLQRRKRRHHHDLETPESTGSTLGPHVSHGSGPAAGFAVGDYQQDIWALEKDVKLDWQDTSRARQLTDEVDDRSSNEPRQHRQHPTGKQKTEKQHRSKIGKTNQKKAKNNKKNVKTKQKKAKTDQKKASEGQTWLGELQIDQPIDAGEDRRNPIKQDKLRPKTEQEPDLNRSKHPPLIDSYHKWSSGLKDKILYDSPDTEYL